MKLHEAIKEALLSKTRIRRECWYNGVYRQVYDLNYDKGDPNIYFSWSYLYSQEEVLADDWVVEGMALKACPFCGGKVFIKSEVDPSIRRRGKMMYAIRHIEEDCLFHDPKYREEELNVLVDKWNTRVNNL